ncbi:MAG: double-strand break repair helicase AddA [Tibeticola sp.]
MTQPAAYTANGQPVDREAFYAIACDPRRSVAVEACAGAGKTWMLVSRIVRALLDGAASHEILAITFTRKAAAEMRGRLQEWLAAFAQEHDRKKLAQELMARGMAETPASNGAVALQNLYKTVLAAPRPVQIRTFHSWFAALLRCAPLRVLEDLGLPANYELLESDEDAVAAVWRPFQAKVAADAALRADYAAIVASHGRTQTRKALEAALRRRTEFALADAAGVVEASVPSAGETFPEFAGWDDPAQALLVAPEERAQLLAAARALGQAAQPSYSVKGGELEQAVTAGDWTGVQDALLTQKQEPRKFSDKLAGIDAVRAAQDAVRRVSSARSQQEAWQYQQRMARLTRVLLDEYAALKRARGWVDMNDVELAARHLLADPVLSGWVQERLDARVKHLLVDEFQDTNPLQWQALHAWLSGYAGAGERPGVFIVGDPKQSIYRFRRAEPQVFKAAQAFVRDGLGGDLLACDHTRRNAPVLIETINTVMLQAQEEGAWSGFRLHTTESPAAGEVLALPPIPREPRAAAADAPRSEQPWRDSLTTPRETAEDSLRERECRQAARWVAERIAAGTPAKEIMVLARQRNRLTPMAEALQRLGIASAQPEQRDLAEAPEVADVLALLDAIVSTAHDLSLARALKSPLFDASDADLTGLALLRREPAHAGRSWWDLLQTCTERLPPTLQAAATSLALYHTWVQSLPPHDALDAIFHHGGVLQRFAQAAQPERRESVLANLRALIAAALALGGGRYLTPYAFVRALRKGMVETPMRADTQAVRLLTIHGAKGLEADVVLMLDTDAPSAGSETMGVLVDWPGEAAVPRRFVFLAKESDAPPSVEPVLAAERTERQREEINALYVAMTRARQVLALSSVQPAKNSGRSPFNRVAPLAQAATFADGSGMGSAGHAQGGSTVFSLPFVPFPTVEWSDSAIENEVLRPPSEPARRGQAMHWLLERGAQALLALGDPGANAGTPAPADATALAVLLRHAAREFDLSAEAVQEAAEAAHRIRTGEGCWAWDGAVVDWQGNEVTLVHRGALLRIDRLVRRRDTGAWWVLDFKSAGEPEAQESLLAQMARYRAAVCAANPGASVRLAFLTAHGRLVEVSVDEVPSVVVSESDAKDSLTTSQRRPSRDPKSSGRPT